MITAPGDSQVLLFAKKANYNIKRLIYIYLSD